VHLFTFKSLAQSAEHPSQIGHKNVAGALSYEELVEKLNKPRKIILLVKAGKAVDDFIDTLAPLLDQGDIIIDGGNSHFPDSIRRTAYLESYVDPKTKQPKPLLFVGCGVSGGEEGARNGPSLMPGGSVAAWPHIKEIFQAVSAQVRTSPNQAKADPCCEWMGANGAGHYVKMVHNGELATGIDGTKARVDVSQLTKVLNTATCN
jgi:6-phosphogluconate dehydrogenase